MLGELEKTSKFLKKHREEKCHTPCRSCALEELAERAKKTGRLYSGFAKHGETLLIPILSFINNETYKIKDEIYCNAAFSGCATGEKGLAVMLLYQVHEKKTNVGEYLG